jgi:dynein heavy chain
LEEAHFNFKDISLSFAADETKDSWKKILRSETPTTLPMPGVYDEKLSSFQKLMVIRVLREEKLVQGIKKIRWF